MINVQKKEFGRLEIKYFSIPNDYPEVIIMEGIYAFHKFNKKVFDIEKFDSYTPTHMHKDYPLVKNESVVAKCNCVKIFLDVDRESARVIRIHRDMSTRHFGNDLTGDKENLEKMFRQNVWPSTDKWISKGKETCDYLIEGGSFNTEQCDKTVKLVLSQFGIVATPKDYSNEPKFTNPRVTYMKIIKK